jgi:hypothetical protein
MRIGIGALADINTVAQTIQTVEGYYAPGTPGYPNGSIAWQLDNPGNLMYAGQAGATPDTINGRTFAKFPTYAAGYQALLNQIQLDASRGQTISQFTASYAPSSDGNDPAGYAQQIAAATGLSTSDLLATAISGASTATPLTLPDVSAEDSGGGDDSSSDSGTDITSMLNSLGLGSVDPTILAAGAAVAGLLIVMALQR